MGYPNKSGAKLSPSAAAEQEKIQSLLGERAGAKPGLQAVKRDDLAALGTIIIKSVHLTAAPTAADFNNLVDDMKAIAAVLNAAGARLTWDV